MRNIQYTEEFKRRIVHDIESGKYLSIHQARLELGIGGKMTLYNWIKLYGKNSNLVESELVSKKLNVQMMENSKDKRIKELEMQLEMVKKTNREKEVELCFYKTLVEVANKSYKIDIKKNFGIKQLKK